MEAVGKDLFEEWMQRIMGRIDRLDGIISVLINKDASGVKYLDGERMYDNQDLCEMLRTSKRFSAANTDSKAGASAARAITRSRTCWSSSAGTWKKLYWTAGKC